RPVFAPASDFSAVTASVTLQWKRSRPGAFRVNLPDDLPERFGAKYNESRFGENPLAPESYPGIVTEPETDADFLGKRINERPSDFVTSAVVDTVALGWAPVTMPFRQPQFLTLGNATRPAQVFLAEEGINGFLALTARGAGAWGNDIAVIARKSSPGR